MWFAALLSAQDDGGAPRVARPQVRISSGMAALGARQPDGGRIIADADTSETRPDGNNVGLEDQMLKMGQVQSDFAAATSIYKKQMGMLKTATGASGPASNRSMTSRSLAPSSRLMLTS